MHHVTWTVDIIEVGTLPDTALSAYVYGALDEVLLDVPCFCWLLRDGQRSLLVDTGPDLEQSVDVGYEVGGDPRASLLAALERCGVSPAGIDQIVHTHLHQDHVQNDALFPNARVLVQREELRSALATEASCELLSAAAREALAAGPYAESQAAGVLVPGDRELLRGPRRAPVPGGRPSRGRCPGSRCCRTAATRPATRASSSTPTRAPPACAATSSRCRSTATSSAP